MKRPDFISLTDWRLLEQKYQNMDYPIRRIENGYPIQYLIGNVDFYGYKIMVNKNVLIPRFETETLVEKTLKYIDEYEFSKASVLEIGTGSGCISVALKKAEGHESGTGRRICSDVSGTGYKGCLRVQLQ